jgi:hypothetical protein
VAGGSAGPAPGKRSLRVQPSCRKGVKASGNCCSSAARAKAILSPGCAGLTPCRCHGQGKGTAGAKGGGRGGQRERATARHLRTPGPALPCMPPSPHELEPRSVPSAGLQPLSLPPSLPPSLSPSLPPPRGSHGHVCFGAVLCYTPIGLRAAAQTRGSHGQVLGVRVEGHKVVPRHKARQVWEGGAEQGRRAAEARRGAPPHAVPRDASHP